LLHHYLRSISINSYSSNICNGAFSSLSATTTQGLIKWWTASSGGSLVGSSQSGANFSVNPTTTTTYYAELHQFVQAHQETQLL